MTNYQEIFEKIPDGVTLHDPADGTILETNQQFCEMLGYSREELLNLDFDAIHVDEPPYTSDRAEQYIRKAATEGPQTFEWRDRTKGGDPLPVEVHLRRTTIDGEDRILACVRDLSERKRRERELERKNERLSEFANMVTHDLRNPLEVANAGLELTQTECDSDHLATVRDAHDRMDRLIDDLLTLARDGGHVGEMVPVNLAELTNGCWDNVATAEARLVIETDSVVRSDRSRLKQLLENLFRNAAEHGGDDVTVTVGDLDDESGFFVVDDGPGVPEEIRNRVFESGFSTVGEGTGFGLLIVKQIADAHGWAVDLSEGEEGGARFEFTEVTMWS